MIGHRAQIFSAFRGRRVLVAASKKAFRYQTAGTEGRRRKNSRSRTPDGDFCWDAAFSFIRATGSY